MSSRSICEFVKCKHLENGCNAFGDPGNDCPIGRFGFVRDLEIFENIYAFASMGEIYETVYKELVPKAVDRLECFNRIKADILNNLSDEEQLKMANFLHEKQNN